MTSEDINNTLEILSSITEDLPGRPSEIMKSKEYNNACEAIEFRLNMLYEKIRMLEELQDAVQEYVDKEISQKEKQYEEKLKIISDLSDQYRDTTFVAQLVPFEPGNESIKDRDGSVLQKMSLAGKKIEVPGTAICIADIDNVSLYTDMACYDSTLDDLSLGRPGIISLTEKEGVLNEAEAEIVIQFKEPVECNYLNIKGFNCEVSNIRMTTEKTETKDSSEDSYMEPVIISGLKATLKTKNNKTVSDYDQRTFPDNFSGECFMRESQSETLKSMLRNENIQQRKNAVKKQISISKELKK